VYKAVLYSCLFLIFISSCVNFVNENKQQSIKQQTQIDIDTVAEEFEYTVDSTWDNCKTPFFNFYFPSKDWYVYGNDFDTSRELGEDGDGSFALFVSLNEINDGSDMGNIMLSAAKFDILNKDLNSFVNNKIRGIKWVENNLEIIENKRMKKDGIVFHKLFYSSTYGKIKNYKQMYFYVLNEKNYVFQYSASDPSWSKNKNIAEKILNSITIIDE